MAKKQKYNTMILDPVEGRSLEDIDDSGDKKNTLGRKFRYGRDLVYLLKKDGQGKLTPVELPPKMEETPEKLYRALFWEKEATILFSLQNTLLEKLKLVGMYVLIGVMLLFMFLIFSSL